MPENFALNTSADLLATKVLNTFGAVKLTEVWIAQDSCAQRGSKLSASVVGRKRIRVHFAKHSESGGSIRPLRNLGAVTPDGLNAFLKRRTCVPSTRAVWLPEI